MVSVLLLAAIFAFDSIASSVGVSHESKKVTDVIVIIESKGMEYGNEAFNIYRNTVLDIARRLPMAKGNVQVTLVQFNEDYSSIERSDGFSEADEILVPDQRKIEMLNRISAMQPLVLGAESGHAGGLFGAFELAANVVVPKILKSARSKNRKRSRIHLVTIVSGYSSEPRDLLGFGDVLVELGKQGVLSYVVAYDAKRGARRSILSLIVSKPRFLILPKHHHTSTAADQLTDVLKVSWKDGPCWPRNPCGYACECTDDASHSQGFKCESLGRFWLTDNCTKPAALLTCGRDSMELRLPKHYVTDSDEPPGDAMVLSGMSNKSPKTGSPRDCLAKVIDGATQDLGNDWRSSAILESEGFYYLLVVPFLDDKCSSSAHSNNDNLTIESVVFITSPSRSNGGRIDVPLMVTRCVYPMKHIRVKNPDSTYAAGRSSSSSHLHGLQSDEGRLDTSALSQTILLAGSLYQEWRERNSFGDPDGTLEIIRKDVRAIVEGMISGRTPEFWDGKEHKVSSDPFATCHPGPYEKGDPCHPMYRTSIQPSTRETIATTIQPATEPSTAPPIPTTQEVLTTLEVSTTRVSTARPMIKTEESFKTLPMSTKQPVTAMEEASTAQFEFTTSSAPQVSTTTREVSISKLETSTVRHDVPGTVQNTSNTTNKGTNVMMMKIYDDEALTREVTFDGAWIGRRIFVLVGPGKGHDPTPGLCPNVRTCSMLACATTSPHGDSFYIAKSMVVMKDGCPMQDNVADLRVLDNGRAPNALFSLLSVRFDDADPELQYYLQCRVTTCDCSRGSCANRCLDLHSLVRRHLHTDARN